MFDFNARPVCRAIAGDCTGKQSHVNQVKSTRCLGLKLDSKLNWNIHVTD